MRATRPNNNSHSNDLWSMCYVNSVSSLSQL